MTVALIFGSTPNWLKDDPSLFTFSGEQKEQIRADIESLFDKYGETKTLVRERLLEWASTPLIETKKFWFFKSKTKTPNEYFDFAPKDWKRMFRWCVEPVFYELLNDSACAAESSLLSYYRLNIGYTNQDFLNLDLGQMSISDLQDLLLGGLGKYSYLHKQLGTGADPVQLSAVQNYMIAEIPRVLEFYSTPDFIKYLLRGTKSDGTYNPNKYRDF